MGDAWWAETFGGDVGEFAEGLVGFLDEFEEHWKEVQSNEIANTEKMKKALRRIAALAEAWAKNVLDASTALAVPTDLYEKIAFPGSSGEPLRELFELFAANSIAINFTREGIYKAEPAARRCIQLLQVVIEAESKDNDPVRKFLKRVARCYIWDFAPECIILCRSALDVALRDRLARTAMRKDAKWQRDKIEDNINRAYTLQLLDKKGKEYAHSVRLQANKALHYQLDITKDILGTIRRTTAVLAQLYRT